MMIVVRVVPAEQQLTVAGTTLNSGKEGAPSDW